MHSHYMPETDDENKVVEFPTHRFWTAMYDSVFDHEVVGMHVKLPAPADKSRHAQHPLVLWLWMTKEAAKQDRKRMIGGQMVYLRRGQLACSERYLAEKANWGRKAVHLFWQRLITFGMISVAGAKDVDQLRLSLGREKLNGNQKGPAISVITICNYDKYQHDGRARGPARGQEGARRGPGGGQNLTVVTEDTERHKKDSPPPVGGNCGPMQALEAFNAYNAVAQRCGLPQAAKLTPSRQKSILARLREYGMAGWQQALANIEKSALLRGSSESGWRADLDFVCQAKSFGRLHDGGYGNGATHARGAAKVHHRVQAGNDFLEKVLGKAGAAG